MKVKIFKKKSWKLCFSFYCRYLLWKKTTLIFFEIVTVTVNLLILHSPVGWWCRIHQLLLCRGVRPLPATACPRIDAKLSDGEVPLMLELWRIRSTPSLPSLPGPQCPGVVAADRVQSVIQNCLTFNCV